MKKVLKDLGAFIVLGLGVVAGVILMFDAFKIGGLQESVIQLKEGQAISGLKLAFGGTALENLKNIKFSFNIFATLAIISPIVAGIIGLFSNKKIAGIITTILFIVSIASILALTFTGTKVIVDLIVVTNTKVSIQLAFLSILSMILSAAGIVISVLKMN